jgi:ribosomal protein S3
MGQRTNPNIFRLGKNKEWKSKYFEKKSPELAKYAFKDSEIRRYIRKFLGDNGLIVHDCRLYYTDSSLYVFVSYYLTQKSVFLIKKWNRTHKIRLNLKPGAKKKNKRIFNKIRKSVKTYTGYYQRKSYKKRILKSTVKEPLVQRSLIKNIQQSERNVERRRVKILRSYKNYLSLKKYKTIKHLEVNSFLNQLLESISLFTNKSLNIFTTFQQLNETIKPELNKKKVKLLKKTLALLRKYNRNSFFKDGVNLMYTCAKRKDSSELLAQFVANELKKLKRHNFFLRFLKATLAIFCSKAFSKLGGIKIKVKGRFNGAPRARTKTIKIGNVPVLTLSSDISYGEAVSFTSNGTFGVKIWTCAGIIKK